MEMNAFENAVIGMFSPWEGRCIVVFDDPENEASESVERLLNQYSVTYNVYRIKERKITIYRFKVTDHMYGKLTKAVQSSYDYVMF